MRAWQIDCGFGIDKLCQRNIETEPCGDSELIVDVRAVSVNFRDLLMIEGNSVIPGAPPNPADGSSAGYRPLIPCSDAAGVVTRVGTKVTRFAIGDRVCPTFFPDWIDGRVSTENTSAQLGGSCQGVLRERIVINQDAAVAVPNHLTFEEAATLPCAAVTAWRSLTRCDGVQAGDVVLVHGTGGVAVFALQFAKALGATVIVTSGSDEKLERMRQLGADHLIHYGRTADWATEVLAITKSRGVQKIIETSGRKTLFGSLQAAAYGGNIQMIGVVSGMPGDIEALTVLGKALRLEGATVGSRADFEAMLRKIQEVELKPIVDKTFDFDQAPDAFRFLRSGGHSGKVCIRV